MSAPTVGPGAGAVTVVRVGPGTSTQDLGRPGFSDVGLGASGAADRGAAALANRMVGNRPDAAVLEALLGSVTLRPDAHVVVATTGAPCPVEVASADGRVRGAAPYEVLMLRPGDELRLGVPMARLRTYVAVRGGFAVEPVLGSRSWDSLARLGPPPVTAGDVLPIGDAAAAWPVVDAVAPPLSVGSALSAGQVLDVLAGPRDDWFLPSWRGLLTGHELRVTQDSDRVGVRTTAAHPLVRDRVAAGPAGRAPRPVPRRPPRDRRVPRHRRPHPGVGRPCRAAPAGRRRAVPDRRLRTSVRWPA